VIREKEKGSDIRTLQNFQSDEFAAREEDLSIPRSTQTIINPLEGTGSLKARKISTHRKKGHNSMTSLGTPLQYEIMGGQRGEPYLGRSAEGLWKTKNKGSHLDSFGKEKLGDDILRTPLLCNFAQLKGGEREGL